MPDMLAAAQHLALDLGWPVLPVKPHGKEPATAHGVRDATTNERTILRWFANQDDPPNLGVATGAPGPSVLDIDDLQAAAAVLAGLENDATPESATARGRHLFYAGTDQATLALSYGELRQRGSYIITPPSQHPSGREYVWLVEPRSRQLPPVPAALVAGATTAGAGIMPEREGKVPHGQRHAHLQDVAVRLVRSGVVDVATLERLLRGEYESACTHDPPARADEFLTLAEWAAGSRIAARERNRAEHRERQEEAEEERAVVLPASSASHAEHLAFIAKLAGLPRGVQVREVRRFGLRPVDGLEIHLSNGQLVDFARQAEAAQRGTWQRAVVMATSGAARPPALKEPQLVALLGSLCLVAHAPRTYTEAEAHAETLREFLALAEPVLGHTLAGPAQRFELIEALRARQRYDPFDRNALTAPALITDERDGARYVRGGELADWFRFKGAALSTRELPGRLSMIGLTRCAVDGREPMPLDPSRPRRHGRVVLYQLGADT